MTTLRRVLATRSGIFFLFRESDLAYVDLVDYGCKAIWIDRNLFLSCQIVWITLLSYIWLLLCATIIRDATGVHMSPIYSLRKPTKSRSVALFWYIIYSKKNIIRGWANILWGQSCLGARCLRRVMKREATEQNYNTKTWQGRCLSGRSHPNK